MTELLDTVYGRADPPLVVAGGSLTARNEALLLKQYPDLLIARGAGEPTIRDVLAHWHGDIDRDQIHGIGYNGAARGPGTMVIGRRHTAKPVSSTQSDILPELDLLPATFEHRGVAQLEASRGCTNFCSFCPRGHKGQWFGGQPDAFGWILNEISAVFDRHPGISRTVYLVDEEFIGRGTDAVPRALTMAQTMHDAGFWWETSCRIDQVVRLDRDRSWHRERAADGRTGEAQRPRECPPGALLLASPTRRTRVSDNRHQELPSRYRRRDGPTGGQCLHTLLPAGHPKHIRSERSRTPDDSRAATQACSGTVGPGVHAGGHPPCQRGVARRPWRQVPSTACQRVPRLRH